MRYALAILLMFGAFLQAQDMSQVTIKTVKINDHLHMLVGDGGNIGVCSGGDGVFMIDDQFAPLTEKIQAAIKAISDQPVKFVVNTHYHFDHTGGNENFGKTGSIIVAHENVRKRLSKEQFMKDFDMTVPAATKVALPSITFTRDMAFHLNGEEMRILHVSGAHTDGDAIVHFPKSNVVHMGDTFFNGLYPYIDVHSGGSVAGMIRVADEVLAWIDEDTQIIPGHGPLGKQADLMAFRDVLTKIQANVKALVDQGKTLEEVIAAKPTAAFDDPWGKAFLSPEKFTGIVYNSVTKK